MASEGQWPTKREVSRLDACPVLKRLPEFPLATHHGPEKTSVRVPNLSNVCGDGAHRSKVVDVNRQRRGSRRGAGRLSFSPSDRGAVTRATRERMVWQKARACVHPIDITLNCGKVGVMSSTSTPALDVVPNSRFSTAGKEKNLWCHREFDLAEGVSQVELHAMERLPRQDLPFCFGCRDSSARK